ncbi:MAG: aminopeptidase, partial [Pirellulaceae bacterium]|nr:aminopeptidase [Pirellulaceae bacterium]
MKLSTSLIAVLGLVLIFIAGPLAADDGALSPELTKRLRQSVKLDRSSKALHNALTNNEDLKALALNRDVVRAHDEVFSHKIKTKKITNQRASGRCWMFAALNVLRPAVIEKHNLKD